MILALMVVLWLHWKKWITRCARCAVSSSRYGRRKRIVSGSPRKIIRSKPEWVRSEIIRLKALMPDDGCRRIATEFNRAFRTTRRVTVGKTYVSDVVRAYRYEIQVLRRHIKHRPPKPVPENLVWALDLTQKTDVRGNRHSILALVEHASRACLFLEAVEHTSAAAMITRLCALIRHYGRPTFLRTDNAAMFTSRWFRLSLWLLGIRHQRIQLHCPWQNGRVERFFGTLKSVLDRWNVDNCATLNNALAPFRLWYNFVRPHQALRERTPAEVWNGTDVHRRAHAECHWFEAWDGLLRGFYLPP